MSDLFSTLIGSAIGTPDSLRETVIPRLQPRFAPIEAMPEAVPAAIQSEKPLLSTQLMPSAPPFELDSPTASAPQTRAPPLVTEAPQASPAPIPHFLPSESPAPTALAPALMAQSPHAASVAAVPIAASAPITTPHSTIFLPIPPVAAAAAAPFNPLDDREPPSPPDIFDHPATSAPRIHPDQARATPSIAIHIGRIEVAEPAPARPTGLKSTTAAPASTARAPGVARAAPRQSLDSYLAGRRR